MAKQSVAADALGVAVAAQVPSLLWGPPGTGKTSAVVSMARHADLPCETVIAAIREPTDFSGLPIVVKGETNFAAPGWAKRLGRVRKGILFLDEITTAPPAVQAALLRVVLERVVGDLALPEGVVIVAAANPTDVAAGGWDLAAPLANRFCHIDWEIEPHRLVDGLVSGWPPATVPVVKDIQRATSSGRASVAGFLATRPSLALVLPDDPVARGRGWPSPRTWEIAGRLWGVAAAAGSSFDVASTLIEGAVGLGAATEFLAWAQDLDLPDPEEMLRAPRKVEIPTRGDRAFAAATALAAAVADDPTLERWQAAWVVLGRIGKKQPDVAATAARALARCRPEGAIAPKEIDVFAPILREAGLL